MPPLTAITERLPSSLSFQRVCKEDLHHSLKLDVSVWLIDTHTLHQELVNQHPAVSPLMKIRANHVWPVTFLAHV